MSAQSASTTPADLTDDATLGDETLRHLQNLLRIDTTNAPGNETPAAEYLADLCASYGLEPFLDGPVPSRKSLVVRLGSTRERPPLLLHAHTDVVPADLESWTHPPFGGEIHDGYVWGRGAIDMKHMAAMAAMVVCRLEQEKRTLTRDIIFAAVADEEAGCDEGSKFLVDKHPDRVRAEYAIGEAGGFTVNVNGQAIYPIQIAEKGAVWMTLKAKGSPGHGSMPRDDNAVVRLSEAIARLGRNKLPHHLTAVAAAYIDAIAAAQPFPQSTLLKQLKNPLFAEYMLRIIPDKGFAGALSAVLRNTVSPTVLRAGKKTNVIPAEAEAEVDGRSLPGMTSADLIQEMRALIGDDIEIRIDRDMPPVETSAVSPLYDAIVETVRKHHPGAVCVPTLMPGFTDAKQWSRLGARCYGFCPVRFPDGGPRFGDLFHGHDERIPVEGLKWGVKVLYDLVVRFAG
jgi:acetylornithine deacetylase/succinyl-diaminopimelate desuccinylase-like protein